MEAILVGDTPEKDLHLAIENFSVGGFFCRASRPMEPMTRLGITFQFPPYAEHPPTTIQTTAVVVRCEKPRDGVGGYEMAACFTELAVEAKKHLQEYVEWHELIYGSAGTANERGR